jgi:hypothetical protein
LELHQIGKLRADAHLRYLYQGPKRPGPGLGCPKRPFLGSILCPIFGPGKTAHYADFHRV